jgi:hypothetical protein
MVGGSAQVQAQYSDTGTPDSLSKAPYLLVGVIALYLVWAIAIQHERIREQLSPANVAVNLHNLIVVGLTAMVFLLVGKIVTAKATILGIPGAAWVAQLFQAA